MTLLHSLHEQAGAEFQPYGEIPIVSTFGQPQAEYSAIRSSAAIFDQSYRGILELTGKDRLPFLNNLLTNQTFDKQAKSGMPALSGVYSFFLNTKGRIVADMNVLELGDRTLLDMDARLVETVRTLLDKYRFNEQVKIDSRLGSLHIFFVTGPSSREAISKVADEPCPDLEPLRCARLRMSGHEVIVYRDDPCGVPGYTLICPGDGAEAIWNRFTENPPARDPDDMRFRGVARPIGWAAFNATRIEGGRPLFGVDFDDSVLPAETGQLSRAVSLTKGCYLGQEIVARMHARGQLARQLVGIRMTGDALPIAGVKIYDAAENEVGGVTSSTVSPVLSNAPICLGYVKKPFIAPGSTVRIPAEGAMRTGTVVELPFIR